MSSFDDIDDPVFAAHAKAEIWPVHFQRRRFDNALSPIGCTTQFQMCKPVNTRCTNLSSILDLFPVHPESPINYDLNVPAEWAIALDLNKRQRSVAMRLFRARLYWITRSKDAVSWLSWRANLPMGRTRLRFRRITGTTKFRPGLMRPWHSNSSACKSLQSHVENAT